jgi:uncharacterized protein (TIRG00374 family)
MNRKVLSTLIKIIVVVAAVVWLRRKVDFAGVGRVLAAANVWFLALAALLYWIPIFIAGFRWQVLLRTLDIPLPLPVLASVVHIGQFFAVLLPGVAGDDGTRFFYISRLVEGRVKQACSTVLLDRLLGFASLFILTTICIPMNWNVLALQPATRWLGVGFLAAGVVMLLLAFLFLICKQTLLERFVVKIKSRFSGSALIAELSDVALAFTGNRGRLCVVCAAALVTQVLICTSFWSAGNALGIHLPLWAWMSFIPIMLVASVFPITFAGIGVRDYLLFLFLGSSMHLGVGADQIAALSLLFLVFTLLLAAIGGLVYLVYKPAPKTAPVVTVSC